MPIRNKVINDLILEEGGVVKGEYYGEMKLEVQVKMHSGRLALKMKNGDKQFEAEFGKQSAIQRKNVDLSGGSKSLI